MIYWACISGCSASLRGLRQVLKSGTGGRNWRRDPKNRLIIVLLPQLLILLSYGLQDYLLEVAFQSELGLPIEASDWEKATWVLLCVQIAKVLPQLRVSLFRCLIYWNLTKKLSSIPCDQSSNTKPNNREKGITFIVALCSWEPWNIEITRAYRLCLESKWRKVEIK